MRPISALSLAACLAAGVLAVDPEPKGGPAMDLKAMRGDWRLDDKNSIFVAAPKDVADEWPEPEKLLASVRIDGNRLYLGSAKEPVALATDVRLGGVEASAEGFRLLCLTFPDGRAVLGSYEAGADGLEVRVPHTCVCGRTGMIAKFVRAEK